MKFLIAIIVNGIVGALLGTVLIGLFALLVSGTAGLANGVVFGATLGFVMGMSLTGVAGTAMFWEGFFNRVGQARQREK